MVKEKKKISGATQARSRSLLQFVTLVVAVIVVNVASDLFYQRFDLTKEKRYTLSEATHDLVDRLDETLYVEVFLEGELPTEYRRLKNATRDMLNEYQHISRGNIVYKFTDVLGDKEVREKENILQQFSGKGLQITRPEVGMDKTTSERYIIPAALVKYKGKEYPLNLLKREFGRSLDDDINASIELLEYEIGNVIRKCIARKKIRIAFTEGHSELDEVDVADISKSLNEFYLVDRININLTDTSCTKRFLGGMQQNPEKAGEILLKGVMQQMNQYDALIVAKPRLNFLDEELFLIDQYVMSGGKVIWLAEPLIAEMDSVAKYGSIMTADYNLNINDLLFRYG